MGRLLSVGQALTAIPLAFASTRVSFMVTAGPSIDVSERGRREPISDVAPRAIPHHRVAIIGAGFGGLGMAIRLLQSGQRDFVVFEKADEVGGTWRDNTYPGCQCDVASNI